MKGGKKAINQAKYRYLNSEVQQFRQTGTQREEKE
jgi:hypothetical protein